MKNMGTKNSITNFLRANIKILQRMKGRKPLPLKIVKAKGTDRASRHNYNQPMPAANESLKQPPKWLDDKDSRAVWRRLAPGLVDTGVLTESDVVSFAHLCVVQSHLQGIKQEIDRLAVDMANKAKEKGQTWGYKYLLPRKAGGLEPNYLIRTYNQTLEKYITLCSEFGMTPSSRNRIKVEKPKEDNPFARFGGGSG